MNEAQLETASQILWRCGVLGILLAALWFALTFLPGNGICALTEGFGLTPHECQLINYGGIGLLKLLTYLFFLVPWVSIRLVLRKRRCAKH